MGCQIDRIAIFAVIVMGVDASTWHVAVEPLPTLHDLELVPMPAGIDRQEQRRRDWWCQLFFGDQSMSSESSAQMGDAGGHEWAGESVEEEPVPACAVRVIVLERGEERFLSVLLDEPVLLRRRLYPPHPGPVTDADLDAVAAMIGRWPAVDSVVVEELSSQTRVVVDGLRERGLPARAVPADMVRVWAESDDQHDDVDADAGPGGWTLHTQPRGYPGALWLDYGSDVTEIARAARRSAGECTVTVAAPPGQRARLGAELDRHGVAWRAEPDPAQVAALPYQGQASSAGLTVRFTISGHGELHLDLAVDDTTTTVVGTAGYNDALGDLISAIRKAITYRRATYCRWYDDPEGCTHIVFVPDPAADAAVDTIGIELWYDEDELAREARTERPRGRWEGPTHALATTVSQSVHSMLATAGRYGMQRNWMPAPHGELDLLDAWLAGHTPHRHNASAGRA